MDSFTSSALRLVGTPRFINVQNKKVSPSLLFSPALAESILFWSAGSLSMRLHSENILGLKIVCAPSEVSGTRLESIDKVNTINKDGTLSLGLASGLLILADSVDSIMKPARKDPNYDYSDFVLNFREVVLKNYSPGETLSFDDFKLNNVFYNNIVAPSINRNSKPENKNGVNFSKP